MTKTGNFLFSLIFLFSPLALALVSVQSSVDPQTVGVGEDLVYTVSVISDKSVEVAAPRPPDLDGFSLLETWDATAVSQKLMPGPNGMEFQSQRRREFNYRLRADRAGRMNIGAFEVTVDGERKMTQPILIEVAKEPQGRGQVGPSMQGMPPGFPSLDDLDNMDQAEEELFRQLLQRRNPIGNRPAPQYRSLPVNPNEAFFIQVEADKTEVYEGEQVTVAWYIYTRGQMESLDRQKFPALRGFWKEIIEEVPTIQFTEEIVNGVPYRKALLATHALFPIRAGTANIDEYKIKSRVRLPVRGGMGWGPAYEYTKSSKAVAIKVKPLPTEGRPANFTGAVGVFDVTARVEASTVPAHQPFLVKVRFEGEGNAKNIDLPAIQWPDSVEVFDTKQDSRFYKNGRSFKEFDVMLVPRKEGELEIPAIAVGVFNPRTGKYEERTTAALKVNVVAGSAGAPSASGTTNALTPPSGAAPATTLPRGPIIPEPVMTYSEAGVGGRWMDQPLAWAAVYLAVFLALVFKAKMEFGGARRRDLREVVTRRFKQVDKTLKEGDPRKVGAEMTNVFSIVLGEIAGEAGASEELSKILERIPPSLRRTYGERLIKHHEVFQVLAFAPESALGDLKSPARLRKEVDEAKSLLMEVAKNVTEESHEEIARA